MRSCMELVCTCLALVALLVACEATTPTPRVGTSSASRNMSGFSVAPDGTRGEFSRPAASEALATASKVAKSQCKETYGPIGTAKVRTQFDPGTGKASSTVITDELFKGTSVGECIARIFLEIEIPPFDGLPVSVTKSVTIQ